VKTKPPQKKLKKSLSRKTGVFGSSSKAKAAIGTFFVRTGDVLVSLTIFIGTTSFAFKLESFAKINVIVAVIWIILSFLTIKEHKRLSAKKATDNQIPNAN